MWRRLVFNPLITNIDDRLHNLGFLHVEDDFWRLAPAFNLNPFPDKTRESKTWLLEDDGPITDVATLMARPDHFSLAATESRAVLADVVKAVSNWKAVALSLAVGLTAQELERSVPAFEHDQLNAA